MPDPTGLLTVLSIPSPSQGTWYLGPLPIRGYALCIIAGIVAAIWIAERRWVARGGRAGDIQDLAVWAVPFGLVGARAYHVMTDAGRYFGEGGNPVEALYLWRGGLGVWGGIALGAVGVVLGARAKGIKVAPVLDAIAPGVLVAQAIGRWGNWFNQELYGRPTDLPWGLEITPDPTDPVRGQYPADTLFHPTFLYESLWSLAAFALLIWLDRRFRLGGLRDALHDRAGLDRVPPHRRRRARRRARPAAQRVDLADRLRPRGGVLRVVAAASPRPGGAGPARRGRGSRPRGDLRERRRGRLLRNPVVIFSDQLGQRRP